MTNRWELFYIDSIDENVYLVTPQHYLWPSQKAIPGSKKKLYVFFFSKMNERERHRSLWGRGKPVEALVNPCTTRGKKKVPFKKKNHLKLTNKIIPPQPPLRSLTIHIQNVKDLLWWILCHWRSLNRDWMSFLKDILSLSQRLGGFQMQESLLPVLYRRLDQMITIVFPGLKKKLQMKTWGTLHYG